MDRKPGLSVAEQRQRKRARLAALAWLKVAYPALFGYPPRPLAIGIGKLIWAAAKDAGVKRDIIGGALHYHVHRHSLSRGPGRGRRDALRPGRRGVGPVEPEHRTEALKLLAVIAENKERHSAPVDREG